MNAPYKGKFNLESDILSLRSWVNEFIHNQETESKEIDAKELAQATDRMIALFAMLKEIAAHSRVYILEEFLDGMIAITVDLHKVATNEAGQFASPNQFMSRLTDTFEAFADRVATKQTRERLRILASFKGVVDGVVASCGGIPYYFEHATRYEKVGMILSAMLLVTALAMTIAISVNPIIAAVPLLGAAIAVCVTMGKVLYEQSVKHAKKRYEDKPIITQTATTLNELEQEMLDYKKGEFLIKANADLKLIEATERSLLRFKEDTFVHFGPHASRAEYRKEIKSHLGQAREKTPPPRQII